MSKKVVNTDDEMLDLMNELAEIVGHYAYSNTTNLDIHHAVKELRTLILADRKKHELQARIDELDAICGWSHDDRSALIFYPEHRSKDFAQMAASGMGTKQTVRERLRELKQELEKL